MSTVISFASLLGVEIAYAYQEVSDVPDFPGKEKLIRQKPWGTGHAVLCAAEHIFSPFAVINADDYYGKNGFSIAARFISAHPDSYALVAMQYEAAHHGGIEPVVYFLCWKCDREGVSIAEELYPVGHCIYCGTDTLVVKVVVSNCLSNCCN